MKKQAGQLVEILLTWAVADTSGGEGGVQAPPIIFTEALVLKSGSTRKFSFQEVEPLLDI